ncbi:MAG: hypothetical protein AABY22_02905 [Nanoarchaeota archaeon]
MKRDPMGEAVERASRRLLNAQARLAERFPLGPSLVELTPAEFRRVAQRNPEGMAQVIAQMGPEAALRMLTPKRPAGSLESLFGEEEV